MNTAHLSLDAIDAKSLTDFYTEKIIASAKAIEALVSTGASRETILAMAQSVAFMGETMRADVGGKLGDIHEALEQAIEAELPHSFAGTATTLRSVGP